MTHGALPPEYLAGFFDGEGSVYANPHSKQLPSLRVCISNTNREVIDLHKKGYGGCAVSRGIPKARWREQYQWVVVGRAATKFLLDIYPHLIIKRAVVAVALEYLEHCGKPVKERREVGRSVYHHGRYWTANRNSEAHIAKALELVGRIRELNGGGFNARRHVPIDRPLSERNRAKAQDERSGSPVGDAVGI
jgi:hypothetical protein